MSGGRSKNFVQNIEYARRAKAKMKTITNNPSLRKFYGKGKYESLISKGRVGKCFARLKPSELCEDCGKMVLFKWLGDYRKCPNCKTETPLKNVEVEERKLIKVYRRISDFKNKR